MKLGLYGGTFDPVHHGHLILARDALEHFGLERMIFIPNTISPHKDPAATPAALRCEMLCAALADEPRFEVDRSELDRAGISYTIDTILQIKERHPGVELFYLIGGDNIAELRTWKRIEELTMLVRFVVADRRKLSSQHPYLCIERRLDISATEIRARVASGRSIRYLVPESVRAMIAANRLYQETP